MNDLIRQETANGALIIANTKDKVLCIFNGQYVRWSYNANHADEQQKIHVYWGHYFNTDFMAAMNHWRDVILEEQ